MQDPDNEIFDVVSEDDEVVGTATRRRCHEEKLIHRSVMFFLFDEQDRVLVNQRSMDKDTFPGYWSIALGGHLDSGEDYETAVRREAMEEAGTDAEPFYLGGFKKRIPEEKENIKVYGFKLHRPPVLEEQEVQKGFFMTYGELKQKLDEESFLPETPQLLSLLEKRLSGES